jgi:hypothetical protein
MSRAETGKMPRPTSPLRPGVTRRTLTRPSSKLFMPGTRRPPQAMRRLSSGRNVLSGFRPDMSEGAWHHSSCEFFVIQFRYCQKSTRIVRTSKTEALLCRLRNHAPVANLVSDRASVTGSDVTRLQSLRYCAFEDMPLNFYRRDKQTFGGHPPHGLACSPSSSSGNRTQYIADRGFGYQACVYPFSSAL